MNRTHATLCLSLVTGLCVVGLLLTGCGKEEPATPAGASSAAPAAAPAAAAAAAPDVPAQTDEVVMANYPISVCVICQGKLGDNKVVCRRGKGAIVVCGKACADKFAKDPAKYLPDPPAPSAE